MIKQEMYERYSLHENQMLQFAQQNDTYSLKHLLKENRALRVHILKTQKMQTVLHLACYSDNFDLIQLYLVYLDRQVEQKLILKQDITNFINAQNDEGFTAQHLTAFKGNFRSTTLLEQYDADPHIRNLNDLSVVHTAAQGDSPLTLYYHLQKGFDINVPDKKGSTPLHWASYCGSLNAVSFLIAWGAGLDLQDSDTGVTALHLAVMQNNPQIVKKLLIKGCDKSIKDIYGKSVLDLARDSNFTVIENMLEDKTGLLELLNIRQPFRPIKSRGFSLLLFVVVYITCFLLTFTFTFPYIENTLWIMVYFFFTCQTLCYYITICLMSPGYVKREGNMSMLEMLKQNDSVNICADCAVVKPKRSRHCEQCQSCILIYDHHCPWINNCVGAKNHWMFYCFIASLFLEFLFQIALQIQNLGNDKVVRDRLDLPLNNQETITGKYITFTVVMFTCLVCLIPVSILLWVQTRNLLTGQTTFERHYKAKHQQLEEEQVVESKKEFNIQTSAKSIPILKNQSKEDKELNKISYFQMCCTKQNKSDFQNEQLTETQDH